MAGRARPSAGAGFTDAYREAHPDPVADPGIHLGRRRRERRQSRAASTTPTSEGRSRSTRARSSASRVPPASTAATRAGPRTTGPCSPRLPVSPATIPTTVALSSRMLTVGDSVTATYVMPEGTDGGTVDPRRAVDASHDVDGAEGGRRAADRRPGAGRLRGRAHRTRPDAVLATNELHLRPEDAQVGADAPTRATYDVGDPVTVRWTDGPANRWDWIGVYRAGAADPAKDDYLVWGYTGGHDAGALPPTADGELVLGRDHQGTPVAAAAGRLRRALPAHRPVRQRRVHVVPGPPLTRSRVARREPGRVPSRRARSPATRGALRMTVEDVGPNPSAFDLESETTANEHYRAVAWTGRYLQVTLMSIPVGESIGLEMHGDTDQFLRLDAGRGQVRMGLEKDELTFVEDVSDGWCVLVPAGTWHDVVNTGDEPMRLYAVYAPTPPRQGQGPGHRRRRRAGRGLRRGRAPGLERAAATPGARRARLSGGGPGPEPRADTCRMHVSPRLRDPEVADPPCLHPCSAVTTLRSPWWCSASAASPLR